MAAAHLAGPPVPKVLRPFVPGCTGRPQHTRGEAEGAVARRGVGRAYPCRHCSAWHIVAGVLHVRWCSA